MLSWKKHFLKKWVLNVKWGLINLKAVVVIIVWFLALQAMAAMSFCLKEESWLIHAGYYALWVIFAWVTIQMFPKK